MFARVTAFRPKPVPAFRLRAFATSANDPLPLTLNNTTPAIEKYKQKLQELSQKEGYKSVEELLVKGVKKEKPKRIPEAEAIAKRHAEQVKQENEQSVASGTAPKKPANAPKRKEGLPSYVKSLDEIVDLDRFAEEDSARIEMIWNEFHASKAGFVSGVMTKDFYEKLKAKGKEYPLFVLPLPRESGVEFFLLQFAFNEIYYTSLLEYKTHMSEARPLLTLTHYDDLADSKNIVLMRGESGKEGGVLKADDARLLVLLTQMFYVTGGESKKKLVEAFNKRPEEFEYQALIDAAEKLDPAPGTNSHGTSSAVSIPEILSIVLHFLDTASLATLRLVSRAWNQTCRDAHVARARNLLHAVLVVAEPKTQGALNTRHNHLSPALLTHALEMAATRAGIDVSKPGVQRDIAALIVSPSLFVCQGGAAGSKKKPDKTQQQHHPILHGLSKSITTPTNFFLVPITLQCTDHTLSKDSKSFVRKFVPICAPNTSTTTPPPKHLVNHLYTTSPTNLIPGSPTDPSTHGPPPAHHHLPHFIATEAHYLPDACLHALVSVHTRRGMSDTGGGIQYTIKCLTGSPASTTSPFSRDTRSFLADNRAPDSRRSCGDQELGRRLRGWEDGVLRDGFVGSLREGVFGSDFCARVESKSWSGGDRVFAAGAGAGVGESGGSGGQGGLDVGEYRSFYVGAETDQIESMGVGVSTGRRQSLFLSELHVTDDWLSHRADPSCCTTPVAVESLSSTYPMGPLYCRTEWLGLKERCIVQGLDLERTGFTDRTLFYLRKYVFSAELVALGRGAKTTVVGSDRVQATVQQVGNSLLQSIKVVMHVWADRLSYFLDHDFKNKMKQADIITKMHFEPEIMTAHLIRLRRAAVERYLDNPIGIKYLQVTGYNTSDLSNINGLFGHLSLPEVHTTRSKAFHESITRCVNMESINI
ncbi:hypothetical protein HDU98_000241 [Podochytrium sp. JEL0797]|nr:hypothetical protein HDU98_000241 [Podochytrium sp. JEL0797]